MKTFLTQILIFFCSWMSVYGQEVSQLNQYIEFLNESTKVVNGRFVMLVKYQEAINHFHKNNDLHLDLPSSGPLEDFNYKKALNAIENSGADKTQLGAQIRGLWQTLQALDKNAKALETFVRLKDYKTDRLEKSNILVVEIKAGINNYAQQKDTFYKDIRLIYQRTTPSALSDPYLLTEKEMETIIAQQKSLIELLPFYLQQENASSWPLEKVKQSLVADEKYIAEFGQQKSQIKYPASQVIDNFRDALQAIQSAKKRAIDNYTYSARQSAEHGNDVYLSLINILNHELLASQESFVKYSKDVRPLLYYPSISPFFSPENGKTISKSMSTTPVFEDNPLIPFTVKKAVAPLPITLDKTLNDYVTYTNESLRQIYLLQGQLRSYQSFAEYHRDPVKSKSMAALTYSHDKFKVPVSAYELLITASSTVPQSYRASLINQAKTLQNILKELDGLGIELIEYTNEKKYLQDRLKRSDEILDRCRFLFETFDQKKEQLYHDVRRVFESYPPADPKSSWYVSGSEMLKTMDADREALFGIRSFYIGTSNNPPATAQIEAGARELIANEYQNMNGLKRYGRSNGLCPYSPYEDLADNSIKLAERVAKVERPSSNQNNHPYESFYFFYNNELVYQYNKFVELAKSGLLKMIMQPNLFVLSKPNISQTNSQIQENESAYNKTSSSPKSKSTVDRETPPLANNQKSSDPIQTSGSHQKTDTVYIERVRVDTVFVDRNNGNGGRTLEGFATNNMVLLLDVSASMESPYKLPLLKRSIKSLLTLLRPEDKLSIVLYSGKARVVLKPTSGAKAAEIGRMIDLLKSSGDTDGNGGISLAYKVANKEYLRGGNNRIILATDGEFPVSNEVMEMIGQNAKQDVYLSVLTFGRNELNGKKLKRLSKLGQGTYAHVTEKSADLQLILEAQAKKVTKK